MCRQDSPLYLGKVLIAVVFDIDETLTTSDLEQVLDYTGIDVVRAYGNATTDIEGFNQGGVSLEEIYIVGKNAGAMGSQAIEGEDYWSHLYSVVEDML